MLDGKHPPVAHAVASSLGVKTSSDAVLLRFFSPTPLRMQSAHADAQLDMPARDASRRGDAPRRVAVIGGGVSGLSAAYLLQRDANAAAVAANAEGKDGAGKDASVARRVDHVTLFESSDALGGHALTVPSPSAGCDVDLGFQVFNMTTYPHLVGLFGTLGVESEPSDMSFSLSTGSVEWGSIGLRGVFAQRSNARSGKFLNMIREILRFGREAPEVLAPEREKEFEDMSLGEYLAAKKYSTFFQESYVVPMCAAIWSCSDEDAMAFPVRTLVRFWVNHHLLNIVERPNWRVVRGRSKAYVDAVEKELRDVRKGTHVRSVHRTLDGSKVKVTYTRRDAKGKTCEASELFDDVVFACHSDQALALLGPCATLAERRALGDVKYQENVVYLHTDETLMPRNRDAWASWNCLRGDRLGISADEAASRSVCVTYWVNLLQNLAPGTKDLFVTLNPPREPAAGTVEHKVTLAHPLFNKAAIAAQRDIKSIQGKDRVWFCGAWCGYGFHEDGIKSAVDCVDEMLGKSSVPWSPRACDPKLSAVTKMILPMFQRACTGWLPANKRLRMILPDGSERVMSGKEADENAETITMTVFNQRLFLQTILRADIGLGECYMNGDFDVDLIDFMDMICKGHPAASGVDTEDCKPKMRYDPVGLLTEAVNWIGAQMEMAAHKALSNTKEGSRKNIEYHYDAGNDFYKLFLDSTMFYSSAIHGDIADANMSVDVLSKYTTYEEREAHLEQSQYAKIDAMIARAQIEKGDHVLEIGCGWGMCAIRMAQTKQCRVTGLTLSHEQHAEATARVKAAGLSHLIDIVICDYRDVQGTFDKVISIEMLEAVGHEHLPTFFGTVHRVLKPGGRAAIQVITMPDGRYESYCNSESDFIRAYIFPGGHLPSIGAMTSAAPRGLMLASYDDIGLHYAVTLRLWRERMMHHAEKILGMGYTRRFLRMFEFYFAYCEAAFANKLIYDLQMTWVKYSDDATINTPSQSTLPHAKDIAMVGAVCAVFAQHNPASAVEMYALAVPLLLSFATVFASAFVLAAISLNVSLPKWSKKVSKVKLDEASSAHGTLTERSLALTVPFMRAAVSAALGLASGTFIDDTQRVRDGAIEWMLPEAKAGKLHAARLLSAFVVVTLGRIAVASARRDASVVSRNALALVATLAALHRDVFVVTGACALIVELHHATAHFRDFTRVASGFPHYETFAYVASRRLAAAAFYLFQVIPTLGAIIALTAHVRDGSIDITSSTAGVVAVTACVLAVAGCARASVAEAQRAAAERLVRARILEISTSADV